MAGTRALTAGEGVVLVAVADVVDVVEVAVAEVVADVRVGVVEVVVVAGGGAGEAVREDDVGLDFEPPQLDRSRALKRMARFLTFAG